MKKLTATAALTIALLLLALSPAWAKKDAGSIYKSKCAGCHGALGEGKSGPKLAGTSLSDDDIVKVLTTGGLSKPPHTKPFKGANGTNAKEVAAYVKSLK
jgi:mono/diheme cytochrome c family protein